MSAGKMLKMGVSQLMRTHGGGVVLYKNYGSSQQSISELRGFKGSDNKNSDQVVFVFLEIEDVQKGDVVQVKGARDLWRVQEVEDNVHGDVLVSFRVFAEKEGGSFRQAATATSNLIVNAPVLGGIQFQSANSTQKISVSISKVEESIQKLGDLVNQCSASELDKEEAKAALERLRALEHKPKSPDVLAKANEKLELVKNTIETAVELGKIAAPYIAVIGSYFAT